MNSHLENFFKSIEEKLPNGELVSSKDLLNAGIVRSVNTLCRWRKSGKGPVFIRISSGQIKYVRASVIEWLRKRAEGGEALC